ncbi:cytochrome P450 93A3 [Artemisia annua]|uniref:Cytochrome P450 93A3 n=1 Tax=Artemisia annua TaxID=35608 RepID=A0A2U1KBG8_ARTAN|nr:cytochrome P450 93A3 [Artemisia annua]
MADFQAYYLSLFLICLTCTILIWAKVFKSSSRNPPTPFGLPIIGHLHLLSPLPHEAFHKLALQYGPMFRLFLGSVPCVVVSSPETAKEILKTNENAFIDRPQNSGAAYITYGLKDFILAPYGPYWTFMKKIVVSQLLCKQTLDLQASVRHDEINRFINILSQNANVGKSVDIGKELMKLTNNVISRMILRKRCTDDVGKEEGDISKLIADTSAGVGNFNISDYIWLFKILDLQGSGKKVIDIRARFDVIFDKIIEEHEVARKQKKTGEEKDLLDMLLDIEQDKSMEIKLSRENIKALIQNLFMAGTDTSASTLKWALAQLINHPDIMKKAKEEIDQVVGGKRLVQESDIPNLPYLQAIVKETLRLHPAAPVIPRKSRQNCNVLGYDIPANTHIFINVLAINKDPNHWENPLEFRPERFETNMVDVRGQQFHFLTFGTGRRMCPGISLAHHIMHTTLGAMLQCFDWKAGKDGNLASVDMEEGTGLTLPRANPLVCVPVARLNPIPFPI